MADSKPKLLIFCFLLISGILSAQDRYMVFYKDKTGTPFSIAQPDQFLTQKSVQRRSRQGIAIVEQDLPVNPTYVSNVKSTGARVMFSSRWFNASLVEATTAQRDSVRALPFVLLVELVAPGKTGTGRIRTFGSIEKAFATEATQNQNSILGLDEMHQDGLNGQGITIAIFDTGFPGVNTNPAFADIIQQGRIRDSYNFSYGLPNVFMGHEHGARVFSIIAAIIPANFTGGAFGADFLLYATEYISTEYRVEEYNWAFAAERADSAGADIISSSLGYNEFNDPTMNYTIADLDGQTAVVTRAATFAFQRGIVVVNAAGNFGNDPWKFVAAPADAINVMAVGSIDSKYNLSSFSSLGPTADGRTKPDVMALGTSASSVLPGGSIAAGDGTSYSCPQIASFVANVWQNWPNLTAVEMLDLIRKSGSRYFNPDNMFGYGVPTYRAVKNILSSQANREGVLVYPNPTGGELNIAMSPNDGSRVDILLRNTSGQELQRMNYQSIWHLNPITMDLTNLAPGVYTIHVSSNHSVKIFRIVKK